MRRSSKPLQGPCTSSPKLAQSSFIAYIPHDAKSKGCDDYFIELGSNDQEYRQRLESTVRPVEPNRLIGWLVENAPGWSTEQRDHEVRRALMLMARMLTPDEFTAWLPALSSAVNIPEVRLHALRSMPNENGWAIRAVKPGKPDLEYVFDDDSTLPAGIKPLWGGRLTSSSGAYLAKCLLYELGAPVLWNDGRLLIYRDGVFSPLSKESVRAFIMAWDGRPIGEKRHLKVSKTTIDNVYSCLIDLLRHASADFFSQVLHGVAFKNGYVQLVDGALVLRSQSPVNRALCRIDADADPDAACSLFDEFLYGVLKPTGDMQDHEERIEALWQWLGLALLGMATKFGKALLLYGPGGTGKSTLLGIISALWPDELRSSFSFHALEDKFDRARLAGMHINVCGELPAANAKSVDMAKAIITGRDDIEARHPYESGFSFLPKTAHVFAANTLPIVCDSSMAFFERFTVLCMENRFRGTEQENRDLAETIIKRELGAIAYKAMKAATEAIAANRITEPPSSAAAIEEWKSLSDPVRVWFAECCEVSDDWTGGRDAYLSFRVWCELNGYQKPSNGVFARSLIALGVKWKKTKSGNWWGMVAVQGEES
jgi:P4 family phage/plasmid primase-like protien